jgi:hypothetical protein
MSAAAMQADSGDSSSGHMNGSQDDSLEGSSEASAVCVCGSPCDDGQNCVQCDGCNEYFHPECIGYTQEQVMQTAAFFCQKCNQELFRGGASAAPAKPMLAGPQQHAMPFASMAAMSASVRQRLAAQPGALGATTSPERIIPPGIDGSLAAELPDSDMDALISLSMLASGRSPSAHDFPAHREERAPPSPSFSESTAARFRLLSVVSPSPHSPIPTASGSIAAALLSPISPIDSGSLSAVSISRSIPRTRAARSHSFSNTMSTPKTPTVAPSNLSTSSGRKKAISAKPSSSLKRTPRSASKTPTKHLSTVTLGSSAPTMGFIPPEGMGAAADASPMYSGYSQGDDDERAPLSSSVPSIMITPDFHSRSAPASAGRGPRSIPRAPNSEPPRSQDMFQDDESEEGGDHKRVFHNGACVCVCVCVCVCMCVCW